MAEWFKFNQLTLNTDKTCYSIFTKKKHLKAKCDLTINKQKITKVRSTKYLGMHLDDQLNWNDHVTHVKNKFTQLKSAMHYISKFIDNQQANDIYHAYVYPHITYGLELYGLTYKKNTKKLQVAQNQIIKVLHKKEQMFCTKELYYETKLLNINQLNELLILNFVYKQRNHLLPKVFENYYVTHKNIKTEDV